jgi:myo-inositol-1(or 4)-monophosphatase
VGVVHVPEFEESYVAARGQGAWLVRDGVGERLFGSDCATLAAAIVATGFGYAAERRRRQAEVVTGLITQVSDVRRMGAAVVDFCWLARGRVDAYYETGLNPWDMAAGGLIAAEAGVVVTGLGDDDTSVSFVAAAPAIAADLRGALVALRADEV